MLCFLLLLLRRCSVSSPLLLLFFLVWERVESVVVGNTKIHTYTYIYVYVTPPMRTSTLRKGPQPLFFVVVMIVEGKGDCCFEENVK